MDHEKTISTPVAISVASSGTPSALVSGRPSISISADDNNSSKPTNLEVVESESESEPDTWKAGKQEWLIVLCLATISMMVALDSSVIVPPLPNIAKAINANAIEAFWIGSAYLVPYAVLQPLIASLSDIFGRRELLLLSVICFTVGSILPALAQHVTQMLVGRVIQGVGGGGIVCLTQVVITDVIPLRHRATFLALPQLSWAIGTITGPLIGGALSSHWTWVFWINLPFAGLGLLMVPLVVKLKRNDQKSFKAGLASLDYVGAILFIGGLTSFLIGISWGGQAYSWSSYHTLVPIILGTFFTALALVYEVKFAKLPFIDLSIYKNYSAIASLAAAFLQGYLLYGGLYVWNIYFQGVRAKSPIHTGVALLPLMLLTIPSTIITGRFIARSGKFVHFVWIGWSLVSIGNGLIIIWFVDTPTVAWAIMEMVCGVGQGMILIAGIVALQAHVEAKDVGKAAAMYSFIRALGLAVGVSLCGTVIQNRLSHWLAVGHLPKAIASDLEAYIVTLNHLPASQNVFASALRLAIAQAHRNFAEVAVAITLFASLLVIGVKQADMNKRLASTHLIDGREKAGDVEMGEQRNDSKIFGVAESVVGEPVRVETLEVHELDVVAEEQGHDEHKLDAGHVAVRDAAASTLPVALGSV